MCRVSTLSLAFTALLVTGTTSAMAQPGCVLSHQKISATAGGFSGLLHYDDNFGGSVAALGDLDGDGITELAVGAHGDDDGGLGSIERGAVWVLFVNRDGTVKPSPAAQKISDTQGGFFGVLDNFDHFGNALAALGDVNGDGVTELAVGAAADDDGGLDRGAVWVLFLNSNGTVKHHQKISATQGGFTGSLSLFDFFGSAVGALGDVDGDGVPDLAVGASRDDDGGQDPGAVWVLFLNPNATVKGHQKISALIGGFTGVLDQQDFFGNAVIGPGDLDGDGIPDLAVGADYDDDGEQNQGAVYLLYLNRDSTVRAHRKISDTQGGFSGGLDNNDHFGISLAPLGDLNGDGINELAVGAFFDDDGKTTDLFSNRGAVWVIATDSQPFGAGDLDGNCLVDGIDLAMLLSAWGRCPASTAPCPADFNGSGTVNGIDLAMLLARWTG